MKLSIMHLKELQVNIVLLNGVFLSMNCVFVVGNCADPDSMPHNVAYYLGLHCVMKFL